MTTIIQVPLAQLRPGGKNVNARREKTDTDSLVRSITNHGLLVPLLVRANGGAYDVMDGNRRLAALREIHKKTATSTVEIPCIDVEQNDALELSMVVNVDRANLHPVDLFEVIAAIIQAGETVEAVAQRRGMTVKQVRQALALGRMAAEVRDAWRDGKIDAETAEAFTLTADHKAQAAALKRVGKYGGAWQVKRELAGRGADYPNEARLLKIVGRDAYEKAGHQINETLFGRDEEGGEEVVSDLPALIRMADDAIEARCEELVKAGWKWAMPMTRAPKDSHAWRRAGLGGNATAEQKAATGCLVGFRYGEEIVVEYGVVKPGDKIAVPRSTKEKKAQAKKRAERKEEGGINNALAVRLSLQLTAAVREALPGGVRGEDALALAIAVLACANEATPHLRLGTVDDDNARLNNEFARYLKLASGKTIGEKYDLLMTWIAAAVNLTAYNGAALNAHLHPDKGDRHGGHVRLFVDQINEKRLLAALRKHFDAKDYFASVSMAMILEAAAEVGGKELKASVGKLKKGKAAEVMVANARKAGWLPLPLRPA
jgi:ParB/RepB/Spo0J family partition protein